MEQSMALVYNSQYVNRVLSAARFSTGRTGGEIRCTAGILPARKHNGSMRVPGVPGRYRNVYGLHNEVSSMAECNIALPVKSVEGDAS